MIAYCTKTNDCLFYNYYMHCKYRNTLTYCKTKWVVCIIPKFKSINYDDTLFIIQKIWGKLASSIFHIQSNISLFAIVVVVDCVMELPNIPAAIGLLQVSIMLVMLNLTIQIIGVTLLV
jgi:hypothetical protein